MATEICGMRALGHNKAGRAASRELCGPFCDDSAAGRALLHGPVAVIVNGCTTQRAGDREVEQGPGLVG